MDKKKSFINAAWIISVIFLVFYVVCILLYCIGIATIMPEQTTLSSSVSSSIVSKESLTPIIILAMIILLIPLAWWIPMIVHVRKIAKGECENKLWFAIVFAIFCNLIAGILMLVDYGISQKY